MDGDDASRRMRDAMVTLHDSFCARGAPWDMPSADLFRVADLEQQSLFDTMLYHMQCARDTQSSALRILHMQYVDVQHALPDKTPDGIMDFMENITVITSSLVSSPAKTTRTLVKSTSLIHHCRGIAVLMARECHSDSPWVTDAAGMAMYVEARIMLAHLSGLIFDDGDDDD